MPTGTLTHFKSERGFGHIRPDEQPGRDVFVHKDQLNSAGIGSVAAGDRFSYEIGNDARSGRTIAVELRLLSGSEARRAAGALFRAGG